VFLQCVVAVSESICSIGLFCWEYVCLMEMTCIEISSVMLCVVLLQCVVAVSDSICSICVSHELLDLHRKMKCPHNTQVNSGEKSKK